VRNQSGEFVGFSLLKNWQNRTWDVDVVYPGTPASREPRLQEKTIILKVNGQSAQEMQYAQLQSIPQGPAGSSVGITVKKGFFFKKTSCAQARGA
jgi:C-terminal processing protease CtpA/Prc